MCKYCEKGKRIEENKDDNTYFTIWGKHLQVTGKLFSYYFGRDVTINYCPMCRKRIERS